MTLVTFRRLNQEPKFDYPPPPWESNYSGIHSKSLLLFGLAGCHGSMSI